jgi:hypothetical protein
MRRRRQLARRAAEMARCASKGGGLMPTPSRDFVPAADSLSCADKKVSKETAPVPSPLRFAAGSPAMLERRGSRRTRFATRRSDSCASRLLQGGAPQQPNSQQPNPKAGWCRLFTHTPFEPAEERRTSSPFAKRTSRIDSRRLFEQSVATRVRRAGLKAEHHREARCEAKGRAVRGRLFAFFLVAQKEGRPPGRTPGMGLTPNTTSTEAPQCL